MKNEMTYYLATHEYAGAYQDDRADYDHATIRTVPERYNMSGVPCLHGHCGTTNDVCTTAHGTFETLEEAKAAIAALDGYSEHRTADRDEQEPETVYVAKPGRYATATRSFISDEFPAGFLREHVKPEMTDGDIDALIDDWNEILTGNSGVCLGSNRHVLERRARTIRDNLAGRAQSE